MLELNDENIKQEIVSSYLQSSQLSKNPKFKQKLGIVGNILFSCYS